jgi:hypothetical protein
VCLDSGVNIDTVLYSSDVRRDDIDDCPDRGRSCSCVLQVWHRRTCAKRRARSMGFIFDGYNLRKLLCVRVHVRHFVWVRSCARGIHTACEFDAVSVTVCAQAAKKLHTLKLKDPIARLLHQRRRETTFCLPAYHRDRMV